MKRLWFVFLLLASCGRALQHVDDVRQSFSIKPGDEGIQSVKLSTAEGELLTCTLKFATRRKSSSSSTHAASLVDDNSVRRPSVQSILSRLNGMCIRKTIEYWKYEICFEQEIKQVHSSTQNILGRFSGLSGPFQLYNEGSACSEKSKAHRKTRVEFQCDRQLRIRSVEEEPSIACSYVMIVGTPIVCSSPDFANAPEDDDGDASTAAAGNLIVEESWMLEAAQVGRARVDCSARSFGNLQVSTLEFSRFELELGSADQAVMQLEMHVARAPDRVRLELDERQVALYGAEKRAQKVRISQGESFTGLLEFVQLLVRVDAK